jgi:hypothetical protein
MSIVMAFKASGEHESERDVCFALRAVAPFKIDCASGPFRVFVEKVELHTDGFAFEGTVSNNSVKGVYNPNKEAGVICFYKETVAPRKINLSKFRTPVLRRIK